MLFLLVSGASAFYGSAPVVQYNAPVQYVPAEFLAPRADMPVAYGAPAYYELPYEEPASTGSTGVLVTLSSSPPIPILFCPRHALTLGFTCKN